MQSQSEDYQQPPEAKRSKEQELPQRHIGFELLISGHMKAYFSVYWVYWFDKQYYGIKKKKNTENEYTMPNIFFIQPKLGTIF